MGGGGSLCFCLRSDSPNIIPNPTNLYPRQVPSTSPKKIHKVSTITLPTERNKQEDFPNEMSNQSINQPYKHVMEISPQHVRSYLESWLFSGDFLTSQCIRTAHPRGLFSQITNLCPEHRPRNDGRTGHTIKQRHFSSYSLWCLNPTENSKDKTRSFWMSLFVEVKLFLISQDQGQKRKINMTTKDVKDFDKTA